jgi:hypothetical protein
MPSASATRPTSMTDSCIALRTATAASGPCLRAIPFEAGGNSAEHQPPLRPEAPNPVIALDDRDPKRRVELMEVVGRQRPV